MRPRSLFALAVAAIASALALSTPLRAETPALVYDNDSRSPFPVPPAEKALQTIVAEPYFKVSDKGLQLEGLSFDRAGNMIFVDVWSGSVFKLTPDRQLTTLMPENKRASAGIAIHKDGRIFVAGLGDFRKDGSVVAIHPDGSGMETIISAAQGYLVDDLVFDADGGFYFTDFRGTATTPEGGVYYASPPDYKKITPILPNLHVANGIALSPDGKTLYVSELLGSRLFRVRLETPTVPELFGTETVYRFTGHLGPDSMRADADGNLYVALYGQGRYMVFNRYGFPIAQILLPGREREHMLRSTSLAIKPGTNDMYLVSNDGPDGEGAMIFHVKSFGQALRMYSHQ